jgi:hypothetical protein
LPRDTPQLRLCKLVIARRGNETVTNRRYQHVGEIGARFSLKNALMLA